MYPLVILETTKDERKKLIIIVGQLINRVSVKLIYLLRTENCHRFNVCWEFVFSQNWSLPCSVWCGWNNYAWNLSPCNVGIKRYLLQ